MNDGIEVSGFFSIGIFKDGKRHSFDLLNIATQEKKPLCSADKTPGWKKFRKFYFNLETVSWGNEILKKAKDRRVIIVDEIGPLEMQGEGWSEGIKAIVNQRNSLQIWIVRDLMIKEVSNEFKIPEMNIFNIDVFTPEAVALKMATVK